MDEKARNRIFILIVLVATLLIWVLVNSQQWVIGVLIYLVMGSFCIFLYSQWGNFGKVSDLEGLDDHWIINSLIGVGLGIGTIILGKWFTFFGVIGIPSNLAVNLGTVGRFVIVCIAAPVIEEVFFRDFLHDLFESKIGLNRYISIGIVAVAFSLTHLLVYGASLTAAGGSFFSAALMGFIFGIVTETRNSLAASIMYQFVLNVYLGFFVLSVIIG